MIKTRKITAGVLVCAMLGGCLAATGADAKTSVKGYTISKDAGTYSGSVSVKVKAKKGYTVYYTTGKKLSANKKIKAKKSKSFVFKKTTVLKIYTVKASKKMTAKKCKAVKDKQMKKYRYRIVSKQISPDVSALPTATTNRDADATPGTTAADTATTSPISPTATPGNTSGNADDDSSKDYIEPFRMSYDTTDTDTSGTGATKINMPASASDSKVTAENYEISKKNKLTITAPGTYLIQQKDGKTIDGLIEVDYADENATGMVHLILNGISMTSSNNTEPTSDTGLIMIKSSVSRAVITVADGTVNTLTDTGKTGIDKEDGVSATYTGGIVCKKTPLTINGSGTLTIVSTYGNGIKCTDEMKIIGTTIEVGGLNGKSAGHNGISAKLNLAVKDADLSIHSDGDCLKTSLDKSDVEQDSTLVDKGNIEIDGGSGTFVSENGDGICAYRTLYLNPAKLTITTKNAAGSLEAGSYKGVKAGTTIFVPETAGTMRIDTTATYSSSRAGRDSNDSVADDAVSCDGNIRIDGGSIEIATGDDAIHSDNTLEINGGNIQITASYEGLESGDISINGGVINVKARDDGMNAAGGNDGSGSNEPGMPGHWFNPGQTVSDTDYRIVFRGGETTIDADGDGIDCNGSIFIMGGTITVNGPTDSGNGALDYGDGANCVCEISGGTLIASGAVGMDSAPTGGSSQPAVDIRLSSTQSAGTYVVLKDNQGNEVLRAQPTKAFQSIVMSCEKLELGSSYTIYYGKDLSSLTKGDTVTFTSVSMSTGSSSGGGWGRPPKF